MFPLLREATLFGLIALTSAHGVCASPLSMFQTSCEAVKDMVVVDLTHFHGPYVLRMDKSYSAAVEVNGLLINFDFLRRPDMLMTLSSLASTNTQLLGCIERDKKQLVELIPANND